MRVLVLGGTGFVGRHVVARLLAAGDQVLVAHRGPAEPADFLDVLTRRRRPMPTSPRTRWHWRRRTGRRRAVPAARSSGCRRHWWSRSPARRRSTARRAARRTGGRAASPGSPSSSGRRRPIPAAGAGTAAVRAGVVRRQQRRLPQRSGPGGARRRQVGRVEPGSVRRDRGELEPGGGRRRVQHAPRRVQVRPHRQRRPGVVVQPVVRQPGVRPARWHLHPHQPVHLPAGLLQQ